jgi:predicted cobalt transporter CbtA
MGSAAWRRNEIRMAGEIIAAIGHLVVPVGSTDTAGLTDTWNDKLVYSFVGLLFVPVFSF